MNEQKRKRFEETLTRAFDHDRYVQFLKELLNNMQIVAPNKKIKPYSTFSAAIDHYRHIGNYMGEDKSRVALFSVCLKNDKNLENARSMQRAFVKTLLESSNCAGALVAFYTVGDLDKWRLSLVRMDYEFSKGKLNAKLTPAKRYSYLVGDGEPCHTAQERLYPIFVADDLDPSLDDLEEAFSVEAVTKEFFDKYREKYLDLKEFLDGNPEFIAEAGSRGFDSEQFAKKLMGQIVFLYFIQKKGWLGVNAFPIKITEREYKSGFYRSGRKPKELMPLVYKQMPDGFFYRDKNALLSLSIDDETILSTLVKGDAWGDGPKNFMRQIFEGCKDAGKNFFDDYLEPLFYTGLNQNRGDNAFFPPLHRRIPFLNGGLFEEMEGYDWRNNDFRIPNELFSNADVKGKRDADGILDVFDRYNFTMAEDEPMEREVAIDPEMLGKVFENLLDITDRKSKGAFYTPREIVHYICQESLIHYVSSNTAIPEADVRKFVLYGEYFRDEDTKKTLPVDNESGRILRGEEIYFIKHHMEFDKNKQLEIPESILSFQKGINRLQEIDDLLSKVKVVDPAVGSGAFPLGMLTEIVKARDTITAYLIIDMNGYQRLSYRSMRNPYRLKRETIKNSIFACDIEASAVDITKLRLWLSLVIDNQIMDQENDEFGYTTKPRELPNLECNVICGNTLMDEFEGIPLLTENAALNNESNNRQMTTFDQTLGVLINELIDLQARLYDEKDHVAKDALKNQIQDIYNQIVMEQISTNPRIVDDYFQAVQMPSKPFVLWQLYFPRVFRDNGGFDIVIGNPPYKLCQPSNTDENTLDFYKKKFKVASYKIDLFHLFFEKGIDLLKKDGVLGYITPNTYLTNKYIKPLRKYVLDTCSVHSIVNHDKVFESASVDTATIVMSKTYADSAEVVVMQSTGFDFTEICRKDQKSWRENPDYVFNINKDDIVEASNCISLGKICKTYFGIQAYDRKSSIAEYKATDKHLPFIDGADIHPYTYAAPKIFFDYRPENIKSGGDWKVYSRERIVVRQIGQIPVVGLCKENILGSNTLYSIWQNDVGSEYDLLFILACLNSEYIKNYWRAKYSDNKATFPKIKGFQLKELPIPIVSPDNQAPVIALVNQVIKTKQDDENANIDDLQSKIDSILNRMYGIK